MNQVEEESFYHSLEDEAIDVDCLLVEPRSDQVSVSGVWCYDEDTLGKCVKTENASYNLGVLDSNINMKGVDTTIFNALNVKRSSSSSDDDYLLDIGFDHGAFIGYVSNEGLHVRNSQFPTEGSFGIHNSSTENISGIECQNYLHNNCIFRTYSSEQKTFDGFDDFSNSFIDQENNHDIMPPHFSPNGSKLPPFCHDEPASACYEQDYGDVGAITQKRSRKPTKRYIDESSVLSLKNSKKRREASSALKVKSSGAQRVKSQTEVKVKPKEKTPSFEISFDKAIQVPFISHVPTECEKSNSPPKIKNCVETHSSGPEDGSETMTRVVTGGNQRKHHRVWTISEVKKLLDGVAHFGVGKWTHIKRLLFSSSVHRTPVDLKDKWRNLLKASNVLKGNRIEDDHKRNQSWRPLPKSILRRVRELASVYACPQETDSKISKSNFKLAPHLSSPAKIKSN